MFNKKISMYLVITFLITWGSWFTVVALLGGNSLKPPLFILYVIGGLGPTISAIITKKLLVEKMSLNISIKFLICTVIFIVFLTHNRKNVILDTVL